MTERKYEKYFLNDPLVKSDFVKYRIMCQGGKTGLGGFMENYFLRWNCITHPVSMEDTHVHDYDEIFHFFGANAEDISDFDAVIELTMGPEKEIYTITRPSIVHVPGGLVHAPLNFKVINKPVIFMNVANTTGYKGPWPRPEPKR
jgi:hypothetical protein